MTADFVPDYLRPLIEWRDKANIPNQAGYLVTLLLVPYGFKTLAGCPYPAEEVRAMVVQDPNTFLHSLVTYAGTPVDFSRVIAWKQT